MGEDGGPSEAGAAYLAGLAERTDLPADQRKPIPFDGLARLAYWQEKRRVEELLEKRRRGFDLAAHEEAMIAYSPFGTAAGCAAGGFFVGSG
jgi:hypothetical protein